MLESRAVWTYIQSHFDQIIPTSLPVAVLAVDVAFRLCWETETYIHSEAIWLSAVL